jgi:dolichol-phosphate mannosyltransferase
VTRVAKTIAAEQRTYEIIIVDDDSGDGSLEVVEELAAEGITVRMVVRKETRGLSSAVIRGFREAKGEYLVCMDADLSHPPEKIPEMIRLLADRAADFVIGSRYVPGASTDETWGLFRWMNSRIATVLAWPFTRVRDPMSGFFALTKSTFKGATALNPIGYKIGLELIVKSNSSSAREIPIHFANRCHGESKLCLREQANYLRHLKRLADFKYGHFSRFAQFCVVGATGMVIDLLAYAAFLYAATPLSISRALAIWMAMTWNFWLNRRLTFSYSRGSHALSQYVRFVAACSFGSVLSWSLSVGLVHSSQVFEEHIFLAAIVGIVAGTVSNFLASHLWVFRKKRAVSTVSSCQLGEH